MILDFLLDFWGTVLRLLLGLPILFLALGSTKYNWLLRVIYTKEFFETSDFWRFLNRIASTRPALVMFFFFIITAASWIIDLVLSDPFVFTPLYIAVLGILFISYRIDKGNVQALLKCKDCVVFKLNCFSCSKRKDD